MVIVAALLQSVVDVNCSIYFKFLFIYFLLGYNCFTMGCQFLLYNNVNQLYLYIQPFLLEPPSYHPSIPLLQVITEDLPELSVLYRSYQLTILHTVMYICQCCYVFNMYPKIGIFKNTSLYKPVFLKMCKNMI